MSELCTCRAGPALGGRFGCLSTHASNTNTFFELESKLLKGGSYRVYGLGSELLKGGYLGDYIRYYHRDDFLRGILGVQTIAHVT